MPDITAKGATLVTLSPQLVDFARAWVDEDNIQFAVLQDLGLAVARDFGLVHKLPDYLQRVYAENLRIDLVRFNGDESWELPMSATFVIDTDGKIVFAAADPDYTARAEPEAVLAAIP